MVPTLGDLAAPEALEVERICTRFEQAWAAGQRPAIEEYLREAPEGARGVLLAELLQVELAYRLQERERRLASEYQFRFPSDGALIDAVFAVVSAEWAGAAGAGVPGCMAPTTVPPRHSKVSFEHAVAAAVPQPGIPEQGADGRATAPSGERVSVPGYEVLGVLGRGGMGVVYKARQVALNRVVALKMILGGGHAPPEDLTRFRTEAEAIARLQHPNIVQIYEVGEQAGLPFFSLEFCPRGSLEDKLDGTPWAATPAAQLVETLARASQAAHERHIIHRDLKPANVLLAEDGTPKVTDFGLAKRLDLEGQTQTGAIMGTPSYMPPEQAGGKTKEVGPAADIYALGAILYELLTGRPPFKAATPLDTILQVLADEPLAVRELQPKTSRDLETICHKCLQKEPRRRYATALALAEDLARFQAGQPVQARPVGRVQRGWRWCRRNPTVAALWAGVLLTFAAGAGVASWFAVRAGVNAERADQKAREAEAKAAEVQQEKERTEQQLDLTRRNLMTAQLLQVQAMYERDPAQALDLLQDSKACPPDLRDFSWGLYARWCRRERLALFGHKGPVYSVAFSPDGQTLASGGEDHTVRLWEAATGQQRALLKGDGPIAFSPDGMTLASASHDKTVRFWEAASGQQRAVAVFKGSVRNLTSVAFSPDGKTLAGDRTSVGFSPEGKTLAGGRIEGTLRLWEATTG